MNQVVFFLPVLKHELIDERTQYLANRIGCDQYTLVTDHKKLKTVSNATVVTDQPFRFGDKPKKVIVTMLRLLEQGNQIKVPGQLSISKEDLKLLELISLLNQVSASTKSNRIKEALFIKKALSGTIHDSSALTPEMVERVKKEFCGGVRKTARRLGVSPASVSRIINNKR